MGLRAAALEQVHNSGDSTQVQRTNCVHARLRHPIETLPDIIAAACPFCNAMMTDGVKNKGQETDIEIMDIAELIANANDL